MFLGICSLNKRCESGIGVFLYDINPRDLPLLYHYYIESDSLLCLIGCTFQLYQNHSPAEKQNSLIFTHSSKAS